MGTVVRIHWTVKRVRKLQQNAHMGSSVSENNEQTIFCDVAEELTASILRVEK